LKGRYYLAKIAHLLLPKHIPEVYQAGESVDGKQAIDVERIAHSPGQALLQELRRTGRDEKSAVEKIMEEQGMAMRDLDGDLEKIGLGFAIDQNVGNYTKNEAGDTYYLETFKPWQADVVDPKEVEVLFDEEALRSAIEEVPDQETKEKCTRYLERLLALLEEEKKDNKELQENRESSLVDCKPGIKSFETTLAPYLKEDFLAGLHAVATQEEALRDERRAHTKAALALVYPLLQSLREKTNITAEEYERLHKQYKTLLCARGVISGGVVDHTR
jgi:hypothetical protein